MSKSNDCLDLNQVNKELQNQKDELKLLSDRAKKLQKKNPELNFKSALQIESLKFKAIKIRTFGGSFEQEDLKSFFKYFGYISFAQMFGEPAEETPEEELSNREKLVLEMFSIHQKFWHYDSDTSLSTFESRHQVFEDSCPVHQFIKNPRLALSKLFEDGNGNFELSKESIVNFREALKEVMEQVGRREELSKRFCPWKI